MLGQLIVVGSGKLAIVGAIVFIILKVADVEAEFPQASVAVNTTVTAAEQSFAIELKLLVQMISEQLSEAIAPPLLANQLVIAF